MRISNALIALLVFVLSLVSLVWQARSPYISLWDEMYHLSYVQYVFEGPLIPAPLQEMGSWSRYIFSCAEVYPNGFVTSLQCGTILPLEAFPEAGRNSAAHWTPIYYFLTATLMVPILGALDLFQWNSGDYWLAARIATATLWSLGCVALYLIVGKIYKSKVSGASVALLASSLPFVFYNGSFVTPYALAPLTAAVIFIVAFQLSAVSTKATSFINVVLLLGLVALSVWALPQNFLLVAILGLSLQVTHFARARAIDCEERGSSIWKVQNFLMPSLFLLSGIFGYGLYNRWNVFQQGRSFPHPNLPSGSFTEPLDNTFSYIESFQFFFWYGWPKSLYSWPFLDSTELAIGAFWGMISSVGIIYALFLRNQRPFIFSTAVSLLLIAPLTGIFYDITLPFGPPTRYFLPIALLGLTFIGIFQKIPMLRNIIFGLCVVTYFGSFALVPFQDIHAM